LKSAPLTVSAGAVPTAFVIVLRLIVL